MKKLYLVLVETGSFVSDSCDSKKHLQKRGGAVCAVFTMRGKLISAARRDENNRIYRLHIKYKGCENLWTVKE